MDIHGNGERSGSVEAVEGAAEGPACGGADATCTWCGAPACVHDGNDEDRCERHEAIWDAWVTGTTGRLAPRGAVYMWRWARVMAAANDNAGDVKAA